MKYGKRVNVRFRYKMDGREPIEKQVYSHNGCDYIYDETLGRMYANTDDGDCVDRKNYSRVCVGLLFRLAERGEIDMWQFSNGTLIWMGQGGKVTNMFDAGIVDWNNW